MSANNYLNKTVVIIGISSDIGMALAKRYSEAGYNIVGTYRSRKALDKLGKNRNWHLFACDFNKTKDIARFAIKFSKLGMKWNIFISCVGSLEPIAKFFDCDFDEWENSININAIGQLHVLHALYKLRQADGVSSAIFFAGGGTNNPLNNYSAYVASKIVLIKMCELLDSESEDLNVTIIGPGWVKTKMHNQTLKAGENAGAVFPKAKELMENGVGTNMGDIYDCIEWIINEGKKVVGGRNISVVHDKWKGDQSLELVKELKRDINMYKLRRYKNEWRS